VTAWWAEYDFPLEEGLTLLGEARCRMTLGDRDQADGLLQRARGILDELGAQGPVGEIDDLLGRSEALSS